MKTKVAIVKCPDYGLNRVKAALKEALFLSGGLDGIAEPGKRILIKPNMLSARPPEEGVTTHPAVVRGLVELVQERGAEALVGDSPGGTNRDLNRFWEKCGYKEVAESTGAVLVNLDQDLQKVSVPGGVIYQELYLSRLVLEVDALITVPKLKTHSLALLTGAVKNLMGLIPGVGKMEIHKRCPKPDQLGEALVDIFSVAKPHLAVMDAVVGMEGNGPVSDKLCEIGIILASRDAVSLDTVAQTVIGLKPFDVPTTRIAALRELGVADLNEIDVLGERLDKVAVENFLLPSNSIVKNIPSPVLKLVARQMMMRPRAQVKNCTGCGICAKSCPAEAISLDKGYARVDYKKCILCLCCYELCPEKAMGLKRGLLVRVLSGLKSKIKNMHKILA